MIHNLVYKGLNASEVLYPVIDVLNLLNEFKGTDILFIIEFSCFIFGVESSVIILPSFLTVLKTEFREQQRSSTTTAKAENELEDAAVAHYIKRPHRPNIFPNSLVDKLNIRSLVFIVMVRKNYETHELSVNISYIYSPLSSIISIHFP